jgi:gamma-glutamyltranspeptidase/glutathione hydrolase
MAFTTRPELRGTFGMVASTHWLASAVGMSVLERGGNAFDAAVSAGFTLQAVEPHLNGPGGEVPILCWSADADEPLVVCGQGVAPAAATSERFRALGLDVVPGTGLLAACVPGAFDAWMVLLRDYGTWRVADVLEPAIAYAEQGFPLVPAIVAAVGGVEQLFRDEWTTSAEVYLPVPEARRLFRNRELAATYRRLVRDATGGSREDEIERARAVWSRGFVAEAIVAFMDNECIDSSGRRHRGLLTGDDLAQWEATYERPVTLDFRGLTVCKTGPWGQGPVFLQQLALLEGFDLADMSDEEWVHVIVECAKLAFADREAWYGDPAFVDVPLDLLLSGAYADERRALVGDAASGELRPGGDNPRLPARVAPQTAIAAGVGEPPRQLRLGDTERRLALRIPRRGGARISARDARADVLARGGPTELAPAAQAPANDADAVARAPRRRAVPRVRNAGR